MATSGASVGAGIATNLISNTTTAKIENSSVESDGGAVIVDADSTALIESITAGGAGAQAFAIGGSVSLNDIRNTVLASVVGDSEIAATGTVRVEAADTSTIRSIAGSVVGALGTAAVGVGVATNDVSNTITSYVDSSRIDADGYVELMATSNALIGTIAAGAGVSTNEISGAAALNSISSTINAYATANELVGDNGIKVSAEDISTIRALAGKAGGAATASIGGAGAFNEIENVIHAYATASIVQSQNGSIEFLAGSTATIESLTASGSVAGTASIAGSIGSQFIGNDVQAYFDGVTADASGNITVVAESANFVTTSVGAVQISGTLGFGGSVAVTDLASVTKAFIANSDISADGTGTSMVPVSDDSTNVQAVQGLAVVAKTTNDVQVITANGSGGGTAGVAAAVSVQLVEDTTESYIAQSSINQSASASDGQSVLVTAYNDTDIDVTAGGLGLGGTVGVGATSDTTILTSTTKAYIAGQSVVVAAADISVATATEERVNSITVSGAGAGTVGVAGNVLVTNIDTTNEAYVDNSTLTSYGDINVIATDEVYLGVLESGDRRGNVAGALGIGFAAGGVGGAVAVNTISNTTLACINDSIVDAANMLNVEADTTEDVVAYATSGAGGFYVGAAAAVTVNTIKTKTTAIITGGSVVNGDATIGSTDQSVRIVANDDASIEVFGGAGSVGFGAVGAAVDVSTIKNRVSAVADFNVEVNAVDSLNVIATSDQVVETFVAAAGAGLGAVQGAVSIVNIGSATTGQANEAAAGADSAANNQIGGSAVGDQMGNSSAAQRAKSRSDAKTGSLSVSDEFDTSANASESLFAAIGAGATVNVGGDIVVEAADRTQVDISAGVGAGGLLGAGGAVAISNINNRTNAVVGFGATLHAGGDIDVSARGIIADSDVIAMAGSAGAVGLGAAVAILNSDNDASATIINEAIIENADALNVHSHTRSDLRTNAEGASFGAVAAGVMVSDVIEEGTSTASIGDRVVIGATIKDGAGVNDLNVQATSDHVVKATGTAAAGGLGAGAGNFATATLNAGTSAQIQAEAQISVRDDINVVSNATNSIDARAYGVVGGLVIAAGATTATVNVDQNIVASVGLYSELAAGDEIKIHSRSTHNANTNATGASGGLATGALVRANTNVDNNTHVDIGTGSKITARDLLELLAESRMDADSNSSSYSIAGAALGDSRATTDIDSQTDVDIAFLAKLAANHTKILAMATRFEAKANALYSSAISLGTIAEANAKIVADSVANVINRGDLVGYGRLELIARQTGVSTRTDSRVDAGIVPFVRSISNNNIDARSNINVQPGSVLRGTNVLIEADSASIAVSRLSDVNSFTIDALEGAVDFAIGILADANAALNAALADLRAAEDDLVDARNDLAAAQQAITDFIRGECGTPDTNWFYYPCVIGLEILLSPLRAAVGAAQLGVETAIGAVNLAQEAVDFARGVVASAESGLRSARRNLENAFGVERIGTARRSNSVLLYGDLFVGAVADRLSINADGTVSGGASGISGQVVHDEFILDDVDPNALVTPTAASFVVNSIGGTIDGSLRIHEQVGLADLEIDSRFAGVTKIGDVVSDSARTITTSVRQNASNRRLSTTKVSGLPPVEIAIESHGDSNLVMAGEVDAVDGTIDVNAVGTVFVEGLLQTTGAMSVSSQFGSILNSATSPHFVAGSLDLSALNGRLGNELFKLQTSVAGLQTAVALDVLAITDLDGDMDIHATSQVSMFLEAANRIDGFASGRDFVLVTGGAIGSAAPFVVHTLGGSLNATAAGDINVSVASGILELEDIDSSAADVIVASSEHLIVSGLVSAANDVFLSSNASIRIFFGTILAGLDSGVIALNAEQEILMTGDDPLRAYRLNAVAGGDLFLSTDVEVIVAASEFAGDLEIHEANDVTLETVINFDGAVRVVAEDSISIDFVESIAPTTDSFVGLISRQGNIEVGAVFADPSSGQISMSAAGQIVDAAGDEAADASASIVMMNAGGTIDVNVDAMDVFSFADGQKIRVKTERSLGVFLETDTDVSVTTDGDLRAEHVATSGRNVLLKSNDGDVYVGSVSAADSRGRIRVQANGEGEFGNIVQVATQSNGELHEMFAGKSVDLKAKGAIQVDGLVVAETGNVSLSAGRDVEIDGAAEIRSGNLLRINNRSGDVQVLGLASASRSVDIRSKGRLTVGGEIVTTEKDVKLSSDDEMIIADDASIQSGNNTSLKTRFGNIGILGAIFAGLFSSRSTQGDIRIDAGGTANIQGELEPLGEVTVIERNR